MLQTVSLLPDAMSGNVAMLDNTVSQSPEQVWVSVQVNRFDASPSVVNMGQNFQLDYDFVGDPGGQYIIHLQEYCRGGVGTKCYQESWFNHGMRVTSGGRGTIQNTWGGGDGNRNDTTLRYRLGDNRTGAQIRTSNTITVHSTLPPRLGRPTIYRFTARPSSVGHRGQIYLDYDLQAAPDMALTVWLAKVDCDRGSWRDAYTAGVFVSAGQRKSGTSGPLTVWGCDNGARSSQYRVALREGAFFVALSNIVTVGSGGTSTPTPTPTYTFTPSPSISPTVPPIPYGLTYQSRRNVGASQVEVTVRRKIPSQYASQFHNICYSRQPNTVTHPQTCKSVTGYGNQWREERLTFDRSYQQHGTNFINLRRQGYGSFVAQDSYYVP